MENLIPYKTKSKWNLLLDQENGNVLTGWYGDMVYNEETEKYQHWYNSDAQYTKIDSGKNLLMYAVLMYDGFSRGRSSIEFRFKAENDFVYVMSASGIDDMLRHMTDMSPEHGEPIYEGWWTFTKQGTQVSMVPAIAHEDWWYSSETYDKMEEYEEWHHDQNYIGQ